MEERTVDHNVSLLTDDQSTIVAEPGESAFDLPSAFIASHLATIVVLSLSVVTAIRADQFDSTTRQKLAKTITVIPFVCDEPLWIFSWPPTPLAGHRYCSESSVDKFHFRRGRRVQVVSQRNTVAVDHHHPLCPLAPAGLADTEPPFLAGAKLPSIKASDQSNCPRWSNLARNARQALSQTSCCSQSFSRRQHVEGLGYSLGKSAHGAPVRRTQRIPSKTLRFSIQGRPPYFDFWGWGNNGSIFFHCASVSFKRSFAIENTPFNDKVGITRSKKTVYIIHRFGL